MKRGTFVSKFGAVAAIGGSVVGLGNIWRFPYLAGENGGAAFILIYILISFMIAVPLMLTEFTIGRATRRNSKRAFQKLAPGTHWNWIGYGGILTAFVILSFYTIIAGWSLEFLKEAILGEFMGKTSAQITENFNSFVTSGWRPIFWMLVFIGATAFIVISGIEKGIERYNKILMPLFIILLIALALNSFTLEGASLGVGFLLNPDFDKVTGSTVLQALGQAFFSLSLGMGCMVTYGSYIGKRENLFRMAATIALMDVGVAVLCGLVIFPAVFSFGIPPTSGPELVFITLPNIFGQMPGGYAVSIGFFSLLFLAAVTSSVSILEVVTAYVTEEMRLPRPKAVLLIALAAVVTGTLCAFSQLPDSSLKIAGESLFDFFNNFSSNVMMPVGALCIVIFAGWIAPKEKFRMEITTSMRYGVRIYPVVWFLIRYVIPVVITLLLIDLVIQWIF